MKKTPLQPSDLRTKMDRDEAGHPDDDQRVETDSEGTKLVRVVNNGEHDGVYVVVEGNIVQP